MTVAAESQTSQRSKLESQLTTWLVLDAEKFAYIALFVLAVVTRFSDLGLRVMSHDESLHTRFSWNLFRGDGYQHTALMHGPLLFHITALNFFLFGDNDFTARIYPAVLGVLLVMSPWLMRKWLGKLGALAASALFLISPLTLYYSRYIRHDIPAILFAMIMAYAIWRHIEKPHLKWLAWLAGAMALLIASKEVAFIYIAIFSSFVTMYLFFNTLVRARWSKPWLRALFWAALIGVVVVGVGMAGFFFLRARGSDLLQNGIGTVAPLDPLATEAEAAELAITAISGGLRTGIILALGAAGALLVTSVAALNLGLRNEAPALDILMVLGTLILPLLTPFAIKAAGYNPLDETPAGIAVSLRFTIVFLAVSVLLGIVWGIRRKLILKADDVGTAPQLDGSLASLEGVASAILRNRWWLIGGIYYALFVFFFTTAFTNGNGLGTGMIESLGYWLEQQGVRRGSQPMYYYALIMLPTYEFMPLLLTIAAGLAAPIMWLATFGARKGDIQESDTEEASPLEVEHDEQPLRFPVLLFIGYWAIINMVAYTLAGEKMPWLTTHLTTPMILIGGWLVGRLLESIRWQRLRERSGWLLLVLTPLSAIALARVLNPLLVGQALLGGQTQEELSQFGLWLTALLALAGGLYGLITVARRIGPRQTGQLVALVAVGALGFQTARAAWMAAYINFDEATEYLVYAHSASSVKLVMDQIEELSLRTTDGYDLKVAYDNRVSWPFSWYLRNYSQAVFYGDQPTRSQLSDAPVILAGPDNWAKVEPLIGDRYHQFEYIRMWWPMQDYFNLTGERVNNALTTPAIRRGIWEIFLTRSYDTYGEATGKDFTLSNWPVAERMRFYVRKDVFAQVWDYGVSASELAEAVDPYAEGYLNAEPILTIGSQGPGPNQFDNPRGMAIGSDGLLYVADSKNHRIQVLTLDGEIVKTLGSGVLSTEPGNFNEPWDVTLDAEGNIFVADTWNHRIQKFDSDGNFITQWGFFGQTADPFAMWGPRGIAVNEAGQVFVTDTGNKRIRVYSTDGQYINQIGTGGSLSGQLDEPVGIAVDASGARIFVADTWNQRVQVFNPAGAYLSEWFLSAWYGQSLANKPYLSLDHSNRVYVVDPEGFRILIFDETGQFLRSFGDFDTFNLASAVAVDIDGNVYVTDGEMGRIQKFAPVLPQLE